MPESTRPDDPAERFLEDLFVREEIVVVEGEGDDPLPPGVTHEIGIDPTADANTELRRRRYSID